MRRLIVLALLLSPLFFTQIFAQTSWSERFKVNKSVDSSELLCLIDSFMKQDCASSVRENVYQGSTTDFYTRKGDEKRTIHYDYLVKFEVDGSHVGMTYSFKNISGTATKCDRTLAKVDISEAVFSLPKEVENFCKNQCSRIKEYINEPNREYKPATENKRPRYFEYDYIIENRAISYFRVIQSKNNLKKEELYHIVDQYFAYAYNDGNSVVQNRDKENCSIVGKGIYAKLHIYNNFCKETYDIPHLIKIDCRDGRIKVTITIRDYDIFREGGGKYVSNEKFKRNPVDYEPFGTMKDEEMDECLEKLEIKINAQFIEIQNAIDSGLTPVDNLDNW